MKPYRRTIEIDIDSSLDDKIDEIGAMVFRDRHNNAISKRQIIEVLIKMGIETAELGVDASRYMVSNIIPLKPPKLM